MFKGRSLNLVHSSAVPHSHDASDEELMLSYQKGDLRAFEVLLSRHKTGVYNFLYRYLGQAENVEEAFQEVFIRVIGSAFSYTPKAKFSTWVYTIARNFCIDLSRKGRFKNTTPLDEISKEGEQIAHNPHPDQVVGGRELMAKLESALSRINSDQREVFLMREMLDLPFDEIADIVKTSVNTVKSRMRYAVAALAAECKKLGIGKT